MYTIEELQETVEYLEEVVNRHEEALSFIVSALKDEPSLSQEAKDDMIEAYYEFYPDYRPKKKKK